MHDRKTMITDLTEGPVAKQLLSFSVPIILANFLQIIYNIVDMIVVGQFTGSVGLSAISISSQVFTIMTTFCIGFATSGQIYISQLVGSRKTDMLRPAIGTLFSVTLIIGVIMTVLGLALKAPVLTVLNTPAEAFSPAMDYMIVCSIGIVFTYGYNVVSAVLRGMGDSKRPLLFIAIAAFINLVLDLLFVGPMGMGVLGAALATIIGQAVSFIISLIYLYRKRVQFGFDFRLKSFAIHGQVLQIYLRLGIPFALKSCAINISIIVITSMVNVYGVAASATFGVGAKIQSIVFLLLESVGTAIASMVGQNVAANKFTRARHCTFVGIGYGWALYTVLGLIFYFFPVPVFSIFTEDPAVLALAPLFLHTFIIALPPLATLQPINGFIQGVGASVLFLCLALMDSIIFRIGLSYLFGTVLNMGLSGFFLGFSLAPYSTMIPNFIFLMSNGWKKRLLSQRDVSD